MMSESENTIPNWNGYKIVFRLLSPLHTGYKKMENIQYARRYVPAKTIWGALTVAITRTQNDRHYKKIGDTIKSNLRFSYFFLSENEDGSKPLIPKYTTKGLEFGHYSRVEFEKRFLDSYASTAILPDFNSAEEESLHEIEILTHYVKDTGYPVFLVGYIFKKQNEDNPYPWQNALKVLQIGGERKYGFGRIELVSCQEIKHTEKLFSIFEFKLNKVNPTVTLSRDNPFPSHVMVSHNESNFLRQDKNNLKKITGETEVLVFRETSQANRFGSNVSNPILSFCPGCIGFSGKIGIFENLILELWEDSSER